MSKVDRRILKSQGAIKKAVVELILEKDFDDITMQEISDRANVNRKTIYLHYKDKYDLLDNLIEGHIQALRLICYPESETSDETQITWFEYFESNYCFFSAVLAGKGAPFFRSRFLEFVIEDFRQGWEFDEARTKGLNEDILVNFFAPAYVGLVEWWFVNKMPYPPSVMNKQAEYILDMNLS
ncbi:TetR/AcrR family transcriptional regulator [Paenibacillus sp. W2I17]|uniref:TetR/AcrR family transcriptional regulator n=1 Tax=Paenibacillus sp. W2I17 TaxID=3042311 RepID=UPI00277D5F5F|nr:TetR/AcrR family transcriptional regulator [Paenibacillus sp. W2I17]MDQ0655946.1 AcrR family transcriptional regulator [Paenibacillus sp. W2I17]